MRKEKAGDTLQATALVNEAFLRLVDDALQVLKCVDPRKTKVVVS
jgi:hypothetical protein